MRCMSYVQMLVCAVHKLQIQKPGDANRGQDAAAGRALQKRERSSGESTHVDWGGLHRQLRQADSIRSCGEKGEHHEKRDGT